MEVPERAIVAGTEVRCLVSNDEHKHNVVLCRKINRQVFSVTVIGSSAGM